jgi:hypothetical protein
MVLGYHRVWKEACFFYIRVHLSTIETMSNIGVEMHMSLTAQMLMHMSGELHEYKVHIT